jgi:hypothetical protein
LRGRLESASFLRTARGNGARREQTFRPGAIALGLLERNFGLGFG